MAKGNYSTGPFLSAAIASIAKSGSVVGGTDFTAHAVPVWDRESVAVQLEATGDASAASGALSFKFYGSFDGSTFGTTPVASAALTLNGSSAVRRHSRISVRGLHSIKLDRVTNADAANSAVSVNAKWGKSYGA